MTVLKINQNKTHKVLVIFDMITDMLCNKKLNLVVITELFIRGRKLNISFAFIMQSYFSLPKNIRPNSTEYFIMKNQNNIFLAIDTATS